MCWPTRSCLAPGSERHSLAPTLHTQLASQRLQQLLFRLSFAGDDDVDVVDLLFFLLSLTMAVNSEWKKFSLQKKARTRS